MDFDLKISCGFFGRNILHDALHPDLGLVWTDGECVYLSSSTDSGLPSLHNTRTLGKFSEVTGCSWSQCQKSGWYYLAVQHKTSLAIWRVEKTRKSTSNPEFKKLYTVEHKELGRGCVWHPRKLLLVVFTKSQAIIYSVESGETTVSDDGLNITAACWTPDGHYLALADGNQLKIFTMDKECETITGIQSSFMEGNLGSVCSMRPISNDVIAIATELPLQKIVTELSADLFSTETSGNEFKQEEIQKSSRSAVCENRASFPDIKDHCNGNALDSDLKMEAKSVPGIFRVKGNAEFCSSFIRHETKRDNASSQSYLNNGHHSNPCANGDISHASSIVEDALKDKSGPIDLMDILSKTKGCNKMDITETAEEKVERRSSANNSNSSANNDNVHASRTVEDALKQRTGPIDLMGILSKTKGYNKTDVRDTAEGKVERPSKDNPSLHSADGDETTNPPKPTDAVRSAKSGHDTRTCVYQVESSEEKPHYHLTKGLKSESNGGCLEGIRGRASIGGNKFQLIQDSRDKSSHSEKENSLVDLMSLKTQGARGVPQFKQTREPGAGSCAGLTLFDVRSKKFVSHTDLPGIITPSIIHYQPKSKVLVVGSHSRRTLSLYALKESSLKRAPQTIELGETERPVGVCSLPDIEGSILVGVTKPVSSDDGSFRGVLPSSAQETRLLSLKMVDLPIGQSTGIKEVADSSSGHHDRTTSSPGNDDGLQTLLLPGGMALNANEESVGRRLGIEVLGEDEDHDAVSVKPLRRQPLATPSQSRQDGVYPPPENAAYVTLRLIKDGHVFQKSFLLQSGLLPLKPIQDVFQVSHVEMQVGQHWIVLTPDSEGLVPLKFNSGSSFDVRDATFKNFSR